MLPLEGGLDRNADWIVAEKVNVKYLVTWLPSYVHCRARFVTDHGRLPFDLEADFSLVFQAKGLLLETYSLRMP